MNSEEIIRLCGESTAPTFARVVHDSGGQETGFEVVLKLVWSGELPKMTVALLIHVVLNLNLILFNIGPQHFKWWKIR